MQCEIARKFFEMLNAITSEQKIPREYSCGQLLYHAETDLLERINEYPKSNVSMLSAESGVTKSAVTQMSAKLCDKGLIERYQSPANKKEKYFRLTEAGHEVRKKHEEQHKNAADDMRDYLCSLQGDKKRIILEFMDKMKKCMPVCAFPCQCGTPGKPCFLATEEKRQEISCLK